MNNPPSKEELIISIINFIENDVISETRNTKNEISGFNLESIFIIFCIQDLG